MRQIPHRVEAAPLLSIITVCLNEPNLERTCESIVSQTFQGFEWIVIDGGSNEKTLAVFEKYRNRMQYFVSEPDDGVYFAMNKGIGKAAGNWLSFMNSGDSFIEETTLEQAYNAIHAEKKDFCVFFGDYSIDGEQSSKFVSVPDEVTKETLFYKPLCHQACFFRRDMLAAAGNYDTQYTLAADYELCLRLLTKLSGTFKKIATPIARYDPYGLSARYSQEIHREIHKVIRHYYNDDEFVRFHMDRIKKVRQLHAECNERIDPAARN